MKLFAILGLVSFVAAIPN